jgi:hypothetical protein
MKNEEVDITHVVSHTFERTIQNGDGVVVGKELIHVPDPPSALFLSNTSTEPISIDNHVPNLSVSSDKPSDIAATRLPIKPPVLGKFIRFSVKSSTPVKLVGLGGVIYFDYYLVSDSGYLILGKNHKVGDAVVDLSDLKPSAECILKNDIALIQVHTFDSKDAKLPVDQVTVVSTGIEFDLPTVVDQDFIHFGIYKLVDVDNV